MPTFELESPRTGRTYRAQFDAEPSEDDLEEVVAAYDAEDYGDDTLAEIDRERAKLDGLRRTDAAIPGWAHSAAGWLEPRLPGFSSAKKVALSADAPAIYGGPAEVRDRLQASERRLQALQSGGRRYLQQERESKADSGQGAGSSFASGVGQEILKALPTMIKGAGDLGGAVIPSWQDNRVSQFGEAWTDRAAKALPTNPALADSFGQKAASAVGQGLVGIAETYLAGGVASKLGAAKATAERAATLAPQVGAFLKGASSGADSAQQHGVTDPLARFGLVAGTGAIEAGTERLGGTGSAAGTRALMGRSPLPGVARAAEMLGSETGEEYAAGAAQPLLERALITPDPQRPGYSMGGTPLPSIPTSTDETRRYLASAEEQAMYGAMGAALPGAAAGLRPQSPPSASVTPVPGAPVPAPQPTPTVAGSTPATGTPLTSPSASPLAQIAAAGGARVPTAQPASPAAAAPSAPAAPAPQEVPVGVPSSDTVTDEAAEIQRWEMDKARPGHEYDPSRPWLYSEEEWVKFDSEDMAKRAPGTTPEARAAHARRRYEKARSGWHQNFEETKAWRGETSSPSTSEASQPLNPSTTAPGFLERAILPPEVMDALANPNASGLWMLPEELAYGARYWMRKVDAALDLDRHLARFGAWVKGMVSQFGEAIRRYLRAIWDWLRPQKPLAKAPALPKLPHDIEAALRSGSLRGTEDGTVGSLARIFGSIARAERPTAPEPHGVRYIEDGDVAASAAYETADGLTITLHTDLLRVLAGMGEAQRLAEFRKIVAWLGLKSGLGMEQASDFALDGLYHDLRKGFSRKVEIRAAFRAVFEVLSGGPLSESQLAFKMRELTTAIDTWGEGEVRRNFTMCLLRMAAEVRATGTLAEAEAGLFEGKPVWFNATTARLNNFMDWAIRGARWNELRSIPKAPPPPRAGGPRPPRAPPGEGTGTAAATAAEGRKPRAGTGKLEGSSFIAYRLSRDLARKIARLRNTYQRGMERARSARTEQERTDARREIQALRERQTRRVLQGIESDPDWQKSVDAITGQPATGIGPAGEQGTLTAEDRAWEAAREQEHARRRKAADAWVTTYYGKEITETLAGLRPLEKPFTQTSLAPAERLSGGPVQAFFAKSGAMGKASEGSARQMIEDVLKRKLGVELLKQQQREAARQADGSRPGTLYADATGLLLIADSLRILKREAKTLTGFARRCVQKFGRWIAPYIKALWQAMKDAAQEPLMKLLEKIGAVKFAVDTKSPAPVSQSGDLSRERAFDPDSESTSTGPLPESTLPGAESRPVAGHVVATGNAGTPPENAQEKLGEIIAAKVETRKMFVASKGKYKTPPPVPFYVASTEKYARNFGDNITEVIVAPENVLDLTDVKADADDGAQRLKSLLEQNGIDTKGVQFLRDDELAQSLNRNLPELARRIQDAGFDAAELNEYVYGGGSDTTMLIVSDKAVQRPAPGFTNLRVHRQGEGGFISLGLIADSLRILKREAKTLTAFARRCVAKFGRWIAPYIKALWQAMKDAAQEPLMKLLEKIGAVKFAVPYEDGSPSTSATADAGQDAAYLAAVEAGDMETAQRMVDEAAGPRANMDEVPLSDFDRNEANDGFLYHVTTKDRIDAIVYEGEGLNVGKSGQFAGAAAQTNSKGKIFLTERSGVSKWAHEIEQQLLHSREYDEDQDPADDLTVIRVPRHLVSSLQDDVAEQPAVKGTDYFTEKPIPASPPPVTRDDSGNVIPLSQRFPSPTPPAAPGFTNLNVSPGEGGFISLPPVLAPPKPGEPTAVFYQGTGPFRVRHLDWRRIFKGTPLTKPMADAMALTKLEKSALMNTAARVAGDEAAAIKRRMAQTGKTELEVHEEVNKAMDDPVEMALLATVSPDLHAASIAMRNLQDNLSECIAVQLGNKTGDSILQNLGRWSRRGYAVFDTRMNWNFDSLTKAAKAGKKLNGQDAAKILRELRDWLTARQNANHAKTPSTPAATPMLIEAQMRQILDRETWAGIVSGVSDGKVGKDVSSLMSRKLDPKTDGPLMRGMGVVTNPLDRFATSVGFQVQFVALHQMQQSLRDIMLSTGLASTAPNDVYWAKVGGKEGATNQRWSGFGELYTTPELLKALQSAKGVMSSADLAGKGADLLRFLSGEAKMAKVALSPNFYSTNVWGALAALAGSGDLTVSTQSLRSFCKAAKIMWGTEGPQRTRQSSMPAAQLASLDAARELTARLEASGVLSAGFEMDAVLDALDNQWRAKIDRSPVADRVAGAVRGGFYANAMGRVGGTAGQVAAAVLGTVGGAVLGNKRINDFHAVISKYLVSGPDNFAKLVSYLNNYETLARSGMGAEAAHTKAVEIVRNTMPDYSKLPAFLREGSRIGAFGSFIAFRWESVRNVGWNAWYAQQELRSGNPVIRVRGAQRLFGLALTQSLVVGLAAMISQADDEEDKAYRETLARPWDKNAQLLFTELDGEKATYLNTGYLLPQSTIAELINSGARGESAGEGLANVLGTVWQQFAQGNVGSDPVLEAIFNQRREGGQRITNREGLAGIADLLMHSIHNLEPGYVTKVEHMVDAAKGRKNFSSTYTMENELLQGLGLRLHTVRHDAALRSGLYGFRDRLTMAKAHADTAWNDWGGATADVTGRHMQQKAVDTANEAIADVRNDYDRWKAKLGVLDISEARIKRAGAKGEGKGAVSVNPRPLRMGRNGPEPVK